MKWNDVCTKINNKDYLVRFGKNFIRVAEVLWTCSDNAVFLRRLQLFGGFDACKKKDTLLLGWQMVDTPRFIYQINLDWNSALRTNVNKCADNTKYRKARRFVWTMEKAPSDFSGRKKPALPCHEMWKKGVQITTF